MVTGASRGLGDGLSRVLLNAGHTVYACSRNSNTSLTEFGRKSKGTLRYSRVNLSNQDDLDSFIELVLNDCSREHPDSFILINNAATITPVGPLETLVSEEIQHHISTNFLAPVFLTRGILEGLSGSNNRTEITVLNISSGAAQSPYFGRSMYCAGKAALEMFTRVVAKEQKKRGLHNRIYAVRPGVVDTSMQELSRTLPNELTHDRDLFLSLQSEKKLLDPQQAAELVLRTLSDERVQSGDIVDIRQLYPKAFE